MQSRPIKQDYFLAALIGLCGFYLGFEVFFNQHAILSVDEFWFAHRVYQYKDYLPYRDFAPYKTVLGYYLLLLPMLYAHDIMQTLIFTKQAIALVNTFILFSAACWLTRFFSRAGVITSLGLLVTAEMVLSYSTNLRVDLLGYWFCFFALLCLLEKRMALAGLLLGLGFITTQKAIWYFAASNGALALCWLFFQPDWAGIKRFVQYNLVCAGVIAAYLAFWSWQSSPHTVLASVFLEAQAMYQLDWYNSARALFWQVITIHNPLLFLLWPLTLLSLCVTYTHDHTRANRFFVVIFSLFMLICLLPYKQVFPYYMQVTIPVFFTLYAAFFTWLYGLFAPGTVPVLLISRSILWAILSLYIAVIAFLSVLLQWPDPYLLICMIPMLLGVYLCAPAHWQDGFSSLFFNLLCVTFIFIGGIYPLTLFSISLIENDGGYQKANVLAINALLQDGSDYVAGIELIYNKTQPIAGMRHLMGPAIDYLAAPTPALRTVMLASLYEDPAATTTSVIAALQQSSVKFFVNNYRMMELPAMIRQYLASEYEHYWGSIYLYAPTIGVQQSSFYLKFSGQYFIETPSRQPVYLNGHPYASGSRVYLVKGHYHSRASEDYRLKLIPDALPVRLEARYQQDDWQRLLY